jgi:hypothetical protein
MPDPSVLSSSELLDSIPDPAILRTWLADTIRHAALLRSLLRVSERKAQFLERRAESGREVSHA